jgi:DNA polymerase elongation subunit (family B)
MKLRAWLHDIEPVEWGVRLHWLPENNVKPVEAFFPFTAEFYITKADRETQAQLLSHAQIERLDVVPRFRFIHDWKPVDVLQLKVNPNHLQQTYFDLRKHWDEYLHNADLSLFQYFCFQTNLFPYVYAEIEIINDRLQPTWRLLEEYTDAEYRSVPFRTLWLQPKFENEHLLRGRLLALSVRRTVVDSEENPIIFENSDEGTLLEECFRYIQQVDPDIIFTRGGDTFFPVLAQHAMQAGVGRIHPGRGPRTLQSYIKRPNTQRGHSYASYGRIYFSQHGIYFDGGRHHYDVGNSFMYKDGNIEGIHELVRLGCSNPQRIARGTIGTTLTAVQMRTAYYQNILIPARKADAEHFRPAWSLSSDVGGLVFSPDVGLHLNVTEYDFLSMYPNIMVHRNVSPETVNCSCCQEEAIPVPLTDHTICVRRPGLVSLALENILDRRAYFKSKKKEHQRYDRRQKVLKWLLVTCFDSNTILPIYSKGKLRLVRIGSYIDEIITNSSDFEGTAVVGVDENYKMVLNPVEDVIRVPSPPNLYRIHLDTGREFTVTGDHTCFILDRGVLSKRSATTLKKGDFLPVLFSIPSVDPLLEFNVISVLLELLPPSEFDKWRIQGRELIPYIQSKRSEIEAAMKGFHSAGAIRSWLLDGFIPLRYFDILNFPMQLWNKLSVGYGRRVGGKIFWIPAHYTLDADLAFVFGYFIGDGNARQSFIRLSVNAADTDLVDWFDQFFIRRFKLQISNRKESYTAMFTLQINSTALVWILNNVFGIPRNRKSGKHAVPPSILNGSEEVVLGFIAGLIASDGDIGTKRNYVRISNRDSSFIEELAYLASRVNLYTVFRKSIPRKGSPMYVLLFSGQDTLERLFDKIHLKKVDHDKIKKRIARDSVLRKIAYDIPVKESLLLKLTQKVRTSRNPRVSDRTRVPREIAQIQLEKIKERSDRLSSNEYRQLEILERLIKSDLGFARVRDIELVPARDKYVYCFSVKNDIHSFIAGTGGILSHNCFGYQGYRNARFGRIEAHEAISAYGRDALTQTQHIVADHNLRVIAGIVDSIWIKREDDSVPIDSVTISQLREQIEQQVRLPIEHAADYHWIVFLPRRHDPAIGVLNRYYGLRKDGTFKVRGIEIRQSSAPLIVKNFQTQVLKLLANARTQNQFKQQVYRAKKLLAEYKDRLKQEAVPLSELMITIHTSRSPDEYVNKSRQAIAAKQFSHLGVSVEPGMKVDFILTDVNAQDPMRRVRIKQLLRGDERYDSEEYCKLLDRAYENLIPPELEEQPITLEMFWN